jgi:hypothetical protein
MCIIFAAKSFKIRSAKYDFSMIVVNGYLIFSFMLEIYHIKSREVQVKPPELHKEPQINSLKYLFLIKTQLFFHLLYLL